MVGMTPEIPRRKAPRREFRFAVPWRHQQHQPVDLATFDALKLLGDLMVDRRRLVTRISVFGEAN